MSEAIKLTQAMLARHHRDGAMFAQLMKDTHENRFGEEFWQFWRENIQPHLPEQATVVDLGTGPGTFLKDLKQRFPAFKAYGVECAEYMFEAMETLPDDVDLISADLHDPELPLRDNSVNVIVASVVVHEMHQPIKAFQEMYRCLLPGGLIYLLDWVRVPLENYLQDHAEFDVFDQAADPQQLEDLFVHFTEHNRYSVADLQFMLEKTGFAIQQSTSLANGGMVRLLITKPSA